MTSIYVEGREIKTFPKQTNSFSEIRVLKILDYARRQLKRIESEKETDSDDLNEEQNIRVEHRMKDSASAWTRWNGIEEVWTPWNRFGEPINAWEELRTKWAGLD